MHDARNNLSGAVSDQLLEHFGEKVYRTIVPRNVRVAEAPSHGLPVLRYDPSSRGAMAYLGLAGELMRRERKRVAG
jgi:chromosome partitioning protein